ncbi:MAG: cytochrome c [Anaerolineae bacterium]|jgi:disulfide bond formation protein DsbB|nr:cytochrome c [Anaerolineae bacterium]
MAVQADKAPSQENLIFPVVFLIVVVIVLAVVFTPTPVRPSLNVAAVAAPTEVAMVSEAPPAALDTSTMDHLTLMALGLEEVGASSVQRGQMLYQQTCAACHGPNAQGMPGNGKTLVGSQFVDRLNDPDLVSFIVKGRQSFDPDNTSGVMMPARGNNPSLTDADINAIVDYLRSLNGARVVEDSALAAAEPAETTTTTETTDAAPVEFAPINFNAVNPAAVAPSGGASGEADVNEMTEAATSGGGGGFTPIDFNAVNPAAVAPSGGASGEASLEDLMQPEATPEPTAEAATGGFAPINFNAVNPAAVAPSSGASGEASLEDLMQPEATPEATAEAGQ